LPSVHDYEAILEPMEVSLPEGLSLRANFAWTFIGNLAYAASQWGMVVVLTKLGSPEIVGQFALGLAVTAPVIMFASLQLRGVQATDAKREFEFGHYLGLRIITTGFAFLIISLIILLADYRLETKLVIFAIALAKCIEAFSDVFYGLLQQSERMDWIAKSMMIKGPSSMLILSLVVYFTDSVLWAAVSIAAVWFLVLIGYDLRRGIKIITSDTFLYKPLKLGLSRNNVIVPQWEWESLRKLFKVTFPLGIVMLFVSINPNLPKYLIEYNWGEYELGIFAAIAYLVAVGTMVVSALGQSASPRMAKYYADGHLAAFKTLLFKLLMVGVALATGGILIASIIGKELLTILYQPEYARQEVLVLLMVAGGIAHLGSFLGYAMTAVRYFRVQLPLFALVAFVTAIVGFLVIPNMNLQGAALALISGAVVQVVGGSLIIKHALTSQTVPEKL
jgi:O-antigen/teichoic acid export membrane protein